MAADCAISDAGLLDSPQEAGRAGPPTELLLDDVGKELSFALGLRGHLEAVSPKP